MSPAVTWNRPRLPSALDRARRRLFGLPAPSVATADATTSTDATSATDRAAVAGIVIAIGRAEFDRLGVALQAALGPTTARPDTPARLEAALADAIAVMGATARPTVVRQPAGLYTPEAWHVHLAAGESVTETAIRRGIREGVFAP